MSEKTRLGLKSRLPLRNSLEEPYKHPLTINLFQNLPCLN